MRKYLLALALSSLAFSTASFADNAGRGTPEEQKACAHDVQKFCRSQMDQPDLIVLNCLQQNRPKLTKACDKVLTDHGQ